MDTTILSTVIINNVRYRTYIDSNDTKDNTGNERISFEIALLQQDVDITTLITAYEEYYKIQGLQVSQYDKVTIIFLFSNVQLGDTDTIVPINQYTFNIDAIENIDGIDQLIIRGDSPENKIIVTVHFDIWQDTKGITHEPLLVSTIRVRFENCIFEEGIIFSDRPVFIVEYVNCEIKNIVQCLETRTVTPESYISVFFDHCVFINMQKFITASLSVVSLKSCTFEYPSVDTSSFLTETEFDSLPTLAVYTCKQVVVECLTIKNIITGFIFEDNIEVSIDTVHITHASPGNPIQTTILVKKCKTISICNINCNGIVLDECTKAVVSIVRIWYSTCRNALYAVKATRITKRLAITAIETEQYCVKTVVAVSACEGSVTIGNGTFIGSETAISVNSITNDVVITDSIFIDSIVAACILKNIGGRVTIMDSIFKSCKCTVNAMQLLQIDFVRTTIIGKSLNGEPPNPDAATVSCIEIATVRAIMQSNFEEMAWYVHKAALLVIEDSVIKTSCLLYTDNNRIQFARSSFDLGNVPIAPNMMSQLHINRGIEAVINECEFSDFTPGIKYITKVVIEKSILTKGIHCMYCGNEEAFIANNTIGYSGENTKFTKGIELVDCIGFTISQNTIVGKPVFVAISLLSCKYCTVDYTNTYDSQDMQFIITSSVNNHIIIDTTKPIADRPKFTISSIFKDVLYFYNRVIYKKLFTIPSIYQSVNAVYDTNGTIVSYVSIGEPWVANYLALVKTELIKRIQNT